MLPLNEDAKDWRRSTVKDLVLFQVVCHLIILVISNPVSGNKVHVVLGFWVFRITNYGCGHFSSIVFPDILSPVLFLSSSISKSFYNMSTFLACSPVNFMFGYVFLYFFSLTQIGSSFHS